MGKHILKVNEITSDQDKITSNRKLQYNRVWGFDPLDLVTKQFVESAIAGVSGFITNQNVSPQVANFWINGNGRAGTFQIGTHIVTEDKLEITGMAWTTGLQSFVGISQVSGTQFSVGAAQGYIIDNTDVTNQLPIPVNYAGAVNLNTPYLGTNPATYLSLDSAGALIMSPTPPDEVWYRTHILLGAVAHPTGAITGVANRPDVQMGTMDQVRDMFRPINLINDGITITNNALNLALANTGGKLYGLGIGFVPNGKNKPSTLEIAAGTPTTFQYRTRTGVATGNTTLIIPGSFDVSGVVTPVGGGAGASTNQRFYLLSNGAIRAQYGQTVYANLTEAVSAAQSESFVVFPNNKIFGILIGILSINKSCVNLSDTSTARFLPVSKFGEAVGGAAGISVGTLQSAYTNSVNPQITTSALLGSLKVKRGSAADTDSIFEAWNGADVTTFLIQGDGHLRVNNNTPGFVTSYFTAGDDINFKVGFRNGVVGASADIEKGAIIFDYVGVGNLAKIGFNRGAGANSYAITFSQNGAEKVRFSANGNVGIGTINPTNTLQIGNMDIDGGINSIGLVGGAVKGDVELIFKLKGVGNPLASMGAFASNYGATSGGILYFSTNSDGGIITERMRITSTGAVGIGTTNPLHKLHVLGTIASDDTLGGQFAIKKNGVDKWVFGANSGDPTENFNIYSYAAAVTMSINQLTGNIGIGTNTPAAKLHVNGLIFTTTAGGEGLRMLEDGAFLSFYNGDGSFRTGYIQGQAVNGTILIESERVNKYILLNPISGGNVGIGTFAPIFKLDVNGDIRAQGLLIGLGAFNLAGQANFQVASRYTATAIPATAGGAGFIWAENISGTAEMRVKDGAGNIVTISPHNSTMIPKEEIEDDMAWFYYSERGKKRINVNMYKAIKLIEKLTGEKLIYQDEGATPTAEKPEKTKKK